MTASLLSFPISVHAAASAAPTLLVFGDSLSAGYGLTPGSGWVNLLEQRMKSAGYAYRIVNASVSGETTAGGATRIEAALREHRPAIIVIELGGNDGLRGLPIEQMRKNLAAIIETSERRGAEPILLGMRLPPNYGTSYTTKFQDMYSGLARRYKIPLVPFLLERIAARADYFQLDMVHPTAAAQSLILEEVWTHLEPVLRARQNKQRQKV